MCSNKFRFIVMEIRFEKFHYIRNNTVAVTCSFVTGK
jgi:hypothetical protein